MLAFSLLVLAATALEDAVIVCAQGAALGRKVIQLGAGNRTIGSDLTTISLVLVLEIFLHGHGSVVGVGSTGVANAAALSRRNISKVAPRPVVGRAGTRIRWPSKEGDWHLASTARRKAGGRAIITARRAG